MAINTIGNLGGYETQRLDKLEQLRSDTKKTIQPQENNTDRVSISDEARLKASMFKAAQDHDGVRTELVADLKTRIESGQYQPDGKDIAANLLRHELDVWG